MSSPYASQGTTVTPDVDQIQQQLTRLEDQFTSLRKQLHHSQRLALLGTMAAMVSHEYNNLMTPIVSFAGYALEQDDPELTRSALNKCLRQAKQACTLSNRILNMSADQDGAPSAVSLRELVDESIECLGRAIEKDNIGLTVDVADDLSVCANPGQIQQVLVNLIQNARQAMLGRRGRLTFRAERIGDEVHIGVADIGQGIRSDDLPHIFEPFFTTKSHADRPDKRGIGLGLTVCNDIVTAHDGRIDVESTLGHGTTFTVVLPAAD